MQPESVTSKPHFCLFINKNIIINIVGQGDLFFFFYTYLQLNVTSQHKMELLNKTSVGLKGSKPDKHNFFPVCILENKTRKHPLMMVCFAWCCSLWPQTTKTLIDEARLISALQPRTLGEDRETPGAAAGHRRRRSTVICVLPTWSVLCAQNRQLHLLLITHLKM